MEIEAKKERIRQLTKQLNEAAYAYYQENKEIISNIEYDQLYDELVSLENETGMVLSKSPTLRVGYDLMTELPKEAHESRMLSLDKTKDPQALSEWLKDKTGLLSWKLDGLTIVLTYEGGKLKKAVTRGNGEVGEVVTSNAKVFENIPLSISFKGKLILRGEAVIKYSDFLKINEEFADTETKYKNPRNLCSGAVRQLNSEITAKRHVNLFAFSLVKAEGIDFENSLIKKLKWLKQEGFQVVDYKVVTAATVKEAVKEFEQDIVNYDIPSDGLVLTLDDLAFGEALGQTAKFPRNSIAFKWKDELEKTKLLRIEWSASRTGLINPIAVFSPVELEGTTVSRASVHNVSILEELKLGIDDEIIVYKANMIIPQIAENLTKSGTVRIPDACPVCGKETGIKEENGVKALYCLNPYCQAKKVQGLSHFVSRNALNIEGLSRATLEKLIDAGLIHDFADLFTLKEYRDVIVTMEGMGEKSFDNLLKSIDTASHTTLPRFLNSLGIEGIGTANARMLCEAFSYQLSELQKANEEELAQIEGIGPVLAGNIHAFFASEENQHRLERLLKYITFEDRTEKNEQELTLKGVTVVITGSLDHFSNRDELKALIEDNGGKVTGSVTAKTTYLINNDTTSSSSKNKKARELNIIILSEDEFLNQYPFLNER